MKCAYKQVQTYALRDRSRAVKESLTKHIFRLLDASAGIVLHEQFGFGRVRLERYHTDLLLYIWDGMERYKSDERSEPEHRAMFSDRAAEDREHRQLRESLLDTHFANLQELRRLGYDYDKVDREIPITDRFAGTWHSADSRRMHEERLRFLEGNRPSVGAYITSTMLYLHDRYGYGVARLRPVHVFVWEQYKRFIELWLAEKDAEALTLVDDLAERAKGYGAVITSWENDKGD